jgi:hypothetical protein
VSRGRTSFYRKHIGKSREVEVSSPPIVLPCSSSNSKLQSEFLTKKRKGEKWAGKPPRKPGQASSAFCTQH